jgi:DNA-binding CsgD family transcriptional regulator
MTTKKARFGDKITPRELECARLISTGALGTDLAIRMGVSYKTFDTHRTNLKRKIGAKSMVDISNWYHQNFA